MFKRRKRNEDHDDGIIWPDERYIIIPDEIIRARRSKETRNDPIFPVDSFIKLSNDEVMERRKRNK